MNWKKDIHDEYIVNPLKKTYIKLIHCYECKYYREPYNEWDVCDLFDKPMLEKDYCSKAERKEK